jgi:hypothetical protein
MRVRVRVRHRLVQLGSGLLQRGRLLQALLRLAQHRFRFGILRSRATRQ